MTTNKKATSSPRLSLKLSQRVSFVYVCARRRLCAQEIAQAESYATRRFLDPSDCSLGKYCTHVVVCIKVGWGGAVRGRAREFEMMCRMTRE